MGPCEGLVTRVGQRTRSVTHVHMYTQQLGTGVGECLLEILLALAG